MISLPVRSGAEPPSGRVRLGRDAMRTLGVEPGETVTVAGDGRTAAVVGDPLDAPGLSASETVLRNAALSVGDRADIEAVTAEPAETVVLAPPEGFGFEGGEGSIKSRLRGRSVTRGDGIAVSLLGGALDVTVTVTAVRPADPGVVVEGTTVSVREEPATPTTARLLDASPTVTYDDIGGLDTELRRLRRIVETPLESPELFEHLGGAPPNGVLLHGPTGTGKTLLATALGTEVGARLFHIPDPEAVDDRFDSGFATLAARALEAAPAVVVVDDLETAAPGETPSTRFRSFIDAVADGDVVVVGTTTRPDAVDPGVRRGGRFDTELEVPPPDREGRREVLAVHTAEMRLAGDVDLEAVAAETHGYVGADLAALAGEAVQQAVGRLPDGVVFGAEELSDTDRERFAVTAADFEAARGVITPTGMREVSIEQPSVAYTDIGGAEAAKREVIRTVEWPLRYPDLFDRLGTDPPTGVLLHGLPGTGKTMLAKAVAAATSANFIPINGPELLNRYVGESERGVREVFERAGRQSPAVVFFDEIDALASARGDDSGSEVVDRVVSQLLTELDGIEPRGDVVIIGATNRPDIIDPALLRPGRLEAVVEVPMPDREAREEIFEVHVRDRPVEGVDLEGLAESTDGYTGSDIAAIVREATLLAMEEVLRSHSFEPQELDASAVTVGPEQFERAIDATSPSVTAEMRDRYGELAAELGR